MKKRKKSKNKPDIIKSIKGGTSIALVASTAFLLLIIYLLSYGPVFYLIHRPIISTPVGTLHNGPGNFLWNARRTVYFPAMIFMGAIPPYKQYMQWWNEKALAYAAGK